MRSNKFCAAVGRTLAVLTVTLSVALMLSSSAWAAEYKVLYRFKGSSDGANPWAGLLFDAAGSLYGTTYWGGAHGKGTAFKLIPSPEGGWTKSVIYSFAGEQDGEHPEAVLVFDAAGSLYGTTTYGGDGNRGTVFKLAPNPDGSWSETVLHRFGDLPDGYSPYAGLVLGAEGELYGTTLLGGASDFGTVFKLKLNPDGSWTESIIHDFSCSDGCYPSAALIPDTAGNLYGTTSWGGTHGVGAVIKLSPNPGGSWTESVLYGFSQSDGFSPYSRLVFDAAGSLYGTTSRGAAYDFGAVFKLTPKPDGTWKKSKLHVFKGPDGTSPIAGLILDAAGDLYGTTPDGGAYDSGTIFKVSPQQDGSWKFTKLRVFKNRQWPHTDLVMDPAGHLYGTAVNGGGGPNYYGVVFRITP